MPKLQRPDGVELHWEARGDGPLVVICHPCFSVPNAFEALAEELVRDHRLVLYHARGTGESTRSGPYDMATDIEDLAALLEELGEAPVLVSFADALNRSVVAGASRPDLVRAVVCPGVAALGAQASYPSAAEGLASSPAVVGALVQLLESDYRSGLRVAVAGGNSQFTEEDVQRRIDEVMAFSPAEATLGRLRSWIRHDAREEGRALGHKLWVLPFPGNVWFPVELLEEFSRDTPDAHIEHIEDGAVSRPDLTAEIVRRIARC